ncbi:hypothetical protein SVIOM74S_10080 [Streptomyces violarus]
MGEELVAQPGAVRAERLLVDVGHEVHAGRAGDRLQTDARRRFGVENQFADLADHQRLLGFGPEPGRTQPLPEIRRPVVPVQLPLEFGAEPGVVGDLLGDRRVRRSLVEGGPHDAVPALLGGDPAHHAAGPFDADAGAVGPRPLAQLTVEQGEQRGVIHMSHGHTSAGAWRPGNAFFGAAVRPGGRTVLSITSSPERTPAPWS